MEAPKNKIKKSGSTMLLTVLIVAAILGTAVSFASFIVSSIRKSKLIGYSQIAYYKAESGMEQALYEIRKNKIQNVSGSLIYPGGSIPCLASGYCSKREIGYTDTFTKPYLSKDQTYQIDLLSINAAVGAGVGSFKVVCSDADAGELNDDYVPTWLEIGYTRIGYNSGVDYWGVDNTDGLAIQKILQPCREDYNEAIAINDSDPSANSYAIRIKTLYDDAKDIAIYAYASSDGTGTALPLSDLSVLVEATQGLTGQKIRIKMPRRSPALGFFDYVIFSESEVIKDTECTSNCS